MKLFGEHLLLNCLFAVAEAENLVVPLSLKKKKNWLRSYFITKWGCLNMGEHRKEVRLAWRGSVTNAMKLKPTIFLKPFL